MTSDTNSIGLYMAVVGSGQSTREVMSGVGTPVSPDGSVESQVGHAEYYWDSNSVQTDEYAGQGPYNNNNSERIWSPFAGSTSTRSFHPGTHPHFGEAIGFSTAVDGDYMVIGAPFGWTDLGTPTAHGSARRIKGMADQEYAGFLPDADCYGFITLDIVDQDLRSLWPSLGGGESIEGKAFCLWGEAWTITRDLTVGDPTEPTSWGAFSAWVTGYDSGGGGSSLGGTGTGSAQLKLQPCESSKDCYGFGSGGGDHSCDWNIGVTLNEAEMYLLGPKEAVLTTNEILGAVRVQGGQVYVFKKPRGKITNATNATPIVITVDDWDVLGNEQRVGRLLDEDEAGRSIADSSGAKIKIEGVVGNTATNGEYYLNFTDGKAELYHDVNLQSPVAGNGTFKAGGSWKGVGPDSWIKNGTLDPPFPGGFSSFNVFHLGPNLSSSNPCATEIEGDLDDKAVLYGEHCFGWSVDIKDKWILVGEPRGKQWKYRDSKTMGTGTRDVGPALRMRTNAHDKEPWHEGSFAAFSHTDDVSTSFRGRLGGDRSMAGRAYIYHAEGTSLGFAGVGPSNHPNPHLKYKGLGLVNDKGNFHTTGYTGQLPNARIAPEYLYNRDDEQVLFDMGQNVGYGSWLETKGGYFSLWDVNSHFGHSVAFSAKDENAPIGPDNPVTILVGAPYSKVDKNETGLLGPLETGGDDAGQGDIVPDPTGDDFGGDIFGGYGSSAGNTPGEGGVPGGGGGSDQGMPGQPAEDPPPSSEPREKLYAVGHAYAFIGAYPDSGNASYSVWRGLPNLYMGNEILDTVSYNASNIQSTNSYTLNNLIGVGQVWDGKEYVDVEPIEDTFKWQRLEHRIYNHNDEAGNVVDGRAEDDRFGWSVDIHGNDAIVGAPRHGLGDKGTNYISNAGAAYVFTRSNHDDYFDIVTPSNSGALFTKYVGYDENPIAISGGHALNVNAPTHHRNEYDNFGHAVSISEDYFAVGAPRHMGDRMGRDFSKREGGAVFVWEKQPGGSYKFDQKLCHNNEAYGFNYGPHIGNTKDPEYIMGSGRDIYSHFGASLSLCGKNLLIGAPFAGGGLTEPVDNEYWTDPLVREKLSTEYIKARNTGGLGSGGNYYWHWEPPDKLIIRHGLGQRGVHSGDTKGSGRSYLFQRRANEEDLETDITKAVRADQDDATVVAEKESYEETSFTLTAGGTEVSPVYSLMRFSKFGIPRGSVINSAQIEMVGAGDDQSPTILQLFAFDEDDGAMPSGGGSDDLEMPETSVYSNFVTKVQSQITLSRSEGWTAITLTGQVMNTASIRGIIQEIVDRPGWSENNSIVIIAAPTEQSTGNTKSFYSANYGTVYSGGNVEDGDMAPKLTINFSSPRNRWRQTHEFKPEKARRDLTKFEYWQGLPTAEIKLQGGEQYGRSVSLSKEDIIMGMPEDLGAGTVEDGETDWFNIGGSGAFTQRDFVGLRCRGDGLPGTPGGNFPHVFSLNTRGHAFLSSEIDLYEGGFAVHSGNMTLSLPKPHVRFTHAMPLFIGVKRARQWTSLYTQGHITSTNSMTLAMRDTPSGNISLFLKNFQFTAGPPELGGDPPLTLHSEGARPATETVELFTMGPLPSTGTISLHHRGGHIPINSPIGEFPEGYPSLYASGSPRQQTAGGFGDSAFDFDAPSLYTAGPITSSASIDIIGPYALFASGEISLYTRGFQTVGSTEGADSTVLNLFLEKATGDIDQAVDLHTLGPLEDDDNISLFTQYHPNCTSSATSSHTIVKLKKQQTILGENVLGTEHGSTGYNMGGLWGWVNHRNVYGDRPRVEWDMYLDGISQWPADSPKHAYLGHNYKNNDGIDVDGKTMAVATLGVRYIEKPIGYNHYPDINGLVKIYDWDGDTDSWTLSQTIKHPNDETEIAPKHISFGSSVAIDDTNGILVIGEYQLILTPSGEFRDPNDYGSDTRDYSGQAHVYRKINGVWTYEATIDGATILSDGSFPSLNDKKGLRSPSQPTVEQHFDRLGTYVAIDNGVIIAGAPGQSFGTGLTIQEQVKYSGAVYVFEYNGSLSRWERAQKLVNPDRALYVGPSGSSDRLDPEYDASYFGLICKIKGDTIVVGAPGQALKLKNGTVQTSDGHRIDGAGAVYIFDKSSGTWSFTKSFHSRGQGSTNEGTVDTSLNYAVGEDYAANFGASLDFYGKNIVVGAPKKKVSDNYLAGESYVLEKSGATWSLKYTLTPTETFSDGNAVHSERDSFGYHVSIMNEDVVLISSPKHSYGVAPSTTADTAGVNTGAIYAFGVKGGNQIHKLVREDAVSNQFFGYNNVAFSQGCDAQIMTLTFGVNTLQEGNILELHQYLSALPLNIFGPLTDNDYITLRTDGVAAASGSIPMFSRGAVFVNSAVGDPGGHSLMLKGPFGANENTSLLTRGHADYRTVMNLHMMASMIPPRGLDGAYGTLSLKTQGPFGASSAGWPYWNSTDNRYARRFNITVKSGWHTNDENKFHVGGNYPPQYYNSDPPVYEWADPILERGRSYVFDLSDESNAGHNFYLSRINDGGGGHADATYDGEFLIGVTGSRAGQGGQLNFTVPEDAPDYLYAHCGHHANMGWRIQIINQRPSTPQGMSLYIDPEASEINKSLDLLIEGSIYEMLGQRDVTSMNLFAKTRDKYPVTSGITLYTKSVGETVVEQFKYTDLYLKADDVEGGANKSTQMNMFMLPAPKVDVTTNMNLSMRTPSWPEDSISLYLHNEQTKKEANIFTPSTGDMSLFLKTDAGTPYGVLPSSAMNLSIPLSGPFGGEEFASTSFDGTFPDAGLDLFIGNNEPTGTIPLFIRSTNQSSGTLTLSLASVMGVHSELSTFMIRGYDDSASGV